MKEHNYAFQNPDTRPHLQRRTQNIYFVIPVILTGWPYYQGRLKFHDLRVVMTITPGIHCTNRIHCTVLFNEQLEFRCGVQ